MLRERSRNDRARQLANRFSVEVMPFQNCGEIKEKFIATLQDYIKNGTGIIKRARIDEFGNKIQETKPDKKRP